MNVVYKFGGSSVRDAERMREVADIICSFPHYLPCVVLSAMGKVRGRAGWRVAGAASGGQGWVHEASPVAVARTRCW